MSGLAIVTKTAYALKNLDIHTQNNKNLQSWIKEQYRNLTPKEGVSEEEAIATLKKAEIQCLEASKTIENGRKELQDILDNHGFDGARVIALATVAKDFL